MGHRLPTYAGICRSPHGHNMTITVKVTVKTFTDFKEVDAELASIVESFDHTMILQDSDPLVAVLVPMGFRVVTLNVEPTTENIATLIFNELHAKLADRKFTALYSVQVQETAKYGARVNEGNWRIKRVQDFNLGD